MDFSQIRLQEQLARLPKDAPERCLFAGHDWSNWGPFIPEAPSLPFVPWRSDEAVPEYEPVKAWRHRFCGQCGCEQKQDYQQGAPVVIADPSGIERRINREAA